MKEKEKKKQIEKEKKKETLEYFVFKSLQINDNIEF